ncbi:MAG: hypothetical protein ABT10_17230 [Novosphingobium sp. SCN 63-17]|uniref:hypothetical protein n=1 Tax=unclassified Novosphingobium TaxID=2644732 RepID=UPI00086CCD4C|nr:MULTISPECIES: hypothetical protein [unclassified Novosphingobium]MBN9145999.1 hypothetical protein [Novosphingobium sp.]MDR6710350.1 hypothetical protein [Novosphingobium sp. 1748]ODU80440.1 MAG: hypothetical protein ABT10_17230 [Novosphingobium sp. SCN 63-17]OJX95802.1 MAG: hypothetical protein BGP00_15850 [Novosphingobium sp. 63-713]
MLRHSFLAALALLPLGASAAAQEAGRSAADILVNGAVTPPGKWNRAETDHFIVLSDGSEAELRRTSVNLEKLQHLLARLYHIDQAHDEVGKLTVTLFGKRSFFKDLGLVNARSAEGPYGAGLSDQRYYDPRADGAVLAVARADQVIDLNTAEARERDCDNAMENDQDCLDAGRVNREPVPRPWTAALYSGVAQHFILAHIPSAYPRWYLDGVGALFSTVAMRDDGAVDYAAPPLYYKQVLRAYGAVRIGDIVTGRYLEPGYRRMVWTPYHAWLTAHFFLYSGLKADRQRSFSRYMSAIAHGTPMAQAAVELGDLRVLQHEFNVYLESAILYGRSDKGRDPGQDPIVTNLSPAQVALIAPRLQMDARLAEENAARREDWLHALRDSLAPAGDAAEAHMLMAEAECRDGHDDLCLEQAEAVLARSPDNALALAWKGMALADKAINGSADRRSADLASARQILSSAAPADARAVIPQIAYFRSFTKARETPPQQALIDMVKVTRTNPAAPAPRLYLAEELVREGRRDLAKTIMLPVLYGGYASHEQALGALLLESGEAERGGSR